MPPALTSRTLDAPDALDGLREQWDELAVALRQPFSAPAWALAWWRHMRPDGAELGVVAVLDGEDLVGIVPVCSTGRSCLPLGRGVAPAEPLAKPGMENEVAKVAAEALAAAAPAEITLELHASSQDWATALADAWPGGGRSWTVAENPVPRVDLGDGFEAWMKSKSSSFRRETKRKRRKLDDAGGGFRFASEETLAADVAEFMRLHRLRLAGQGGSSLTDEGVEAMLTEVGSELLASGRFRLLCMELEGKTVAAQLLMAAGTELSAWNSGFDEAYSKYSPSMSCLIEALADGSERGERTMSLGPGAQDYKYRLSGDEDVAVTRTLIPRGIRSPVARAKLTGTRLRGSLARKLRSAGAG